MSESPAELMNTNDDDNSPAPESGGKRDPAPVFKFGLFIREVIKSDLSYLPARVVLRCTECNKTYEHPSRANTTTLKKHFRAKHMDSLIAKKGKAQVAVESGVRPLKETILASDLLPASQPCEQSKVGTHPAKRRQGYSGSTEKTRKKKKENVRDPNILQEENNIRFIPDISVNGFEKVVPGNIFETMIMQAYNLQVSHLRQELAENEGLFSLTFDEWKSNNRYKYLGVTLHFYNDSLELKHRTIGFEVLENVNSITGDVLMERLWNLLIVYGIEDRLISISTDNAGPMKALLYTFEDYYKRHSKLVEFLGNIRCAGHVLKVSAEAILRYSRFSRKADTPQYHETVRYLECNHEIPGTLTISWQTLPVKIRKIIKAVRDDPALQKLFAECVRRQQLNEKTREGPATLLKDNKTQWLSTFDMIDSFVYFKDEVNEFLDLVQSLSQKKKDTFSLDVYEISQLEWDYLSNLRNNLSVYHQSTLQLQDSKQATINLTLSCMEDVEKYLRNLYKNIQENPYLNRGILEAHAKLLSYYPTRGTDSDQMLGLYVAAILDPRKKQRGISQEIITWVDKHFKKVYLRYESVYGKSQSSEASNTPEYGVRASSQFSSEKARVSFTPSSADELSAADIKEFELYLSETLDEHYKSVVEFYQAQRDTYPILYHMAKDYLAIPAMSAPAESLSLRINDFATQKGNRMLPEQMKIIAFVSRCGACYGPEENPPSVHAREELSELEDELYEAGHMDRVNFLDHMDDIDDMYDADDTDENYHDYWNYNYDYDNYDNYDNHDDCENRENRDTPDTFHPVILPKNADEMNQAGHMEEERGEIQYDAAEASNGSEMDVVDSTVI